MQYACTRTGTCIDGTFRVRQMCYSVFFRCAPALVLEHRNQQLCSAHQVRCVCSSSRVFLVEKFSPFACHTQRNIAASYVVTEHTWKYAYVCTVRVHGDGDTFTQLICKRHNISVPLFWCCLQQWVVCQTFNVCHDSVHTHAHTHKQTRTHCKALVLKLRFRMDQQCCHNGHFPYGGSVRSDGVVIALRPIGIEVQSCCPKTMQHTSIPLNSKASIHFAVWIESLSHSSLVSRSQKPFERKQIAEELPLSLGNIVPKLESVQWKHGQQCWRQHSWSMRNHGLRMRECFTHSLLRFV